MTECEKFNKIVNFEMPDSPLRWHTLGFWKQTLELWKKENYLTPNLNYNEYFNLTYPVFLPGNTGHNTIPFTIPFEEKILEINEDTLIIQRKDGITSKEYKNGSSMPQWLSFPVKTREDWQQVKGRILPDRHVFGEHYSEQISKHVDNPDVNCIFICGIYAFQRLLMGEENLAYAYFDMPDVLLDMAWHWLELYTAICSRIIRDSRVDFILFHEDMAYKTGPLIGPDLFRQFMSPFYRDLIRQMKGLNVQNFMIDCDGNIDILLPMFYELGINMMGPFEQAAGNDILEIGRKFPDLVMWGGIDKRVLNMTKSEIEKEILEKVPVMYKRGGFIASIDHSTQPCPMENFVYYLELLRKVWESL